MIAVVDASGEVAGVLDEELAQLGVVNEPARAGELVPRAAAVSGPVLADWLGLSGLDRAGANRGSPWVT